MKRRTFFKTIALGAVALFVRPAKSQPVGGIARRRGLQYPGAREEFGFKSINPPLVIKKDGTYEVMKL